VNVPLFHFRSLVSTTLVAVGSTAAAALGGWSAAAAAAAAGAISYLTNRLSSRDETALQSQAATKEDIRPNHHLTRLAGNAIETILQRAKESGRLVTTGRDEQYAAALRHAASVGRDRWIELLEEPAADSPTLSGKDLTDAISDHLQNPDFAHVLSKRAWAGFVRLLFRPEDGLQMPAGFDHALSEMLYEEFAREYYEHAAQSAARNPVVFAAIQLHFLAGLRIDSQRHSTELREIREQLAVLQHGLVKEFCATVEQITPTQAAKLGGHLQRLGIDSQELETLGATLPSRVASLLQPGVSLLRRRLKWVLALVSTVILIGATTVIYVVRIRSAQEKQRDDLARANEEQLKLREALRNFSQAMIDSRQWSGRQPGADDGETILDLAYEKLARAHGIEAQRLKKELPRLAAELLARADTGQLDRAAALYLQRLYSDAEREALEAGHRAIEAANQKLDEGIQALLIAGHSADQQFEYARGFGHYEAAAAHCNAERNLQQWTLVQANIGASLSRLGKFDEALPILRQTLSTYERLQGPDHPETLRSMNNLALILQEKGEFMESEKYFRQALEGYERVLKRSHPETVRGINNLGGLLLAKGAFAEAEMRFRTALEAYITVFGAEHFETLTAKANLAGSLKMQRRFAEAEKVYRETLTACDRIFNPKNPLSLTLMNNMADMFRVLKRLPEAEGYARQALSGRAEKLGVNHPQTVTSRNNLALILGEEGKLDEAVKLLRLVVDGCAATFGKEHRKTLTSIASLALYLKKNGEFEEAEKFYNEALRRRTAAFGENDSDTWRSNYDLAIFYSERGNREAARPFATKAYQNRSLYRGSVDEVKGVESRLRAILANDFGQNRFVFVACSLRIHPVFAWFRAWRGSTLP
jgi:Tfp pilus assembly protein PilF